MYLGKVLICGEHKGTERKFKKRIKVIRKRLIPTKRMFLKSEVLYSKLYVICTLTIIVGD